MEGKSVSVDYAEKEKPKRNSLLKHHLAHLFYNCVVFKKKAKAQTNQSKRTKEKFEENPKGCINTKRMRNKKRAQTQKPKT